MSEDVTIWAVRDGFVVEVMKQSSVSTVVGVSPNTEATAAIIPHRLRNCNSAEGTKHCVIGGSRAPAEN